MVWFQVNVPLVLGCLLMAALMDLRVFKVGLLVSSMLLMFSAVGVIVFGTNLEMISANAVAVVSVMVWLACATSVIRRWFRSRRQNEPFVSMADRTGTREVAVSVEAWMLNPELPFGPVQLVRLQEPDGMVPLARTFDSGIPQIAIGPDTKNASAS
jgi:hypothetical protein